MAIDYVFNTFVVWIFSFSYISIFSAYFIRMTLIGTRPWLLTGFVGVFAILAIYFFWFQVYPPPMEIFTR